jgi:hypothetical protein
MTMTQMDVTTMSFRFISILLLAFLRLFRDPGSDGLKTVM